MSYKLMPYMKGFILSCENDGERYSYKNTDCTFNEMIQNILKSEIPDKVKEELWITLHSLDAHKLTRNQECSLCIHLGLDKISANELLEYLKGELDNTSFRLDCWEVTEDKTLLCSFIADSYAYNDLSDLIVSVFPEVGRLRLEVKDFNDLRRLYEFSQSSKLKSYVECSTLNNSYLYGTKLPNILHEVIINLINCDTIHIKNVRYGEYTRELIIEYSYSTEEKPTPQYALEIEEYADGTYKATYDCSDEKGVLYALEDWLVWLTEEDYEDE